MMFKFFWLLLQGMWPTACGFFSTQAIGSRQIGNPTAFHPPSLGKALSAATLSAMTQSHDDGCVPSSAVKRSWSYSCAMFDPDWYDSRLAKKKWHWSSVRLTPGLGLNACRRSQEHTCHTHREYIYTHIIQYIHIFIDARTHTHNQIYTYIYIYHMYIYI